MALAITVIAALAACMYLVAFTADAKLVQTYAPMPLPGPTPALANISSLARRAIMARTCDAASCFHTLLLCLDTVVPSWMLPTVNMGILVAHEVSHLERTGFTAQQLFNCLIMLSWIWTACEYAHRLARHGNASVVFMAAVLVVKVVVLAK